MVLFHFDLPHLRGGYIGVDVFFVLSGFLITTGILNELKAGSFSFKKFYIKRIFRLLPPAFFVIACVLVFAAFSLSLPRLQSLAEESLWALVSLVNFKFYNDAGYWDQSSLTKPLLHFWSLSVEEQFYFVWPLWLFLIAKLAGLSKIRGVNIFIMCAVFGYVVYAFPTDPAEFFYMSYYRTWQFIAGSLVGIYSFERFVTTKKIKALPDIVFCVGLLLVIASAVAYDHTTPYPYYFALAPTVGAIGLIIAGKSSRLGGMLLTNPIAVYIGKISYSLYLTHWPVVVFYKSIYNSFPYPAGIKDFFILVFFTIITTLAVYYYVEKKFRYAFGNYWIIVGLFLFNCALSWTIISYEGNDFRVDPKFANLSAEHQGGGNVRRGCRGEELYTGKLYCHLGPKKESLDILVLGDSHGDNFINGMKQLAKAKNYSIGIISVPGVLPIPGGVSHGIIDSKSRKKAFTPEIFEYIYNSPPKLVILAARWDAHVVDKLLDRPHGRVSRFEYGQFTSLSKSDSQLALENGLRDFATRLSSHGINTIIFGNIPIPGFTVRDCMIAPALLNSINKNCASAEFRFQQSYLQETDDILKRAIHGIKGVTFANSKKPFCRGKTCEYIINDKVLYRDDDHLSVIGSKYFVRRYRKLINKLVALSNN